MLNPVEILGEHLDLRQYHRAQMSLAARPETRAGHHIDLVKKLSEYLGDEDIFAMGNEMRKKRNFDLYSGGVLISKKEALNYKEWLKKIVSQAEKYLNTGQKLF